MTPDLPEWTSLDARISASGLDREVWNHLQLRWGQAGGLPVGRTVRLVVGPLPPTPPGPPTRVPVSGEVLEVWTRGDEVWLGEHLHLHAGSAGTTLSAAGPQVPETAWVLAFVEAHRAGGWLPLHACVLTRENSAVGQEAAPRKAVAITGVSGAGKSTAALRLAGAGFSVLAEDQVWVHPPSGRVVGFDTHLRAFEDSVRRFAPGLLREAAGHDAHGKLLLPLIQPGGQARLESLLVFGPSPIPDAAGRVRAVWEATGVPLTTRGRRAAAAGVTTLLPRLSIRGVTREDVMQAVGAALGAQDSGTPG